MKYNIVGFPPIAREDAEILILGTMPGAASLRQQHYYAHPANAFWPIMQALFAPDETLSYSQRTELLIANNIALWDVLQQCSRKGSLDAHIQPQSIKTNEFSAFLHSCNAIKRIYFNGAEAEKLFFKHVKPALPLRFSDLTYQRLPSTSPAHASLNLQQKIAAWEVIRRDMVK